MLSLHFGEGNDTPLQYSCLENPMEGGAWWAAVNGVSKSRTRLSDFIFTFHFHALEKEIATRSSLLAWRIPGMGEPGGLPSMGSHRVGYDSSDLAAAAAVSIYTVSGLCLVTQLCPTLCDPWTVACQAPLSMGILQEYWSGFPCPPPGDLPNPGMNPGLRHCRWILYHLSHHGSLRNHQFSLCAH